MDAFEPAQQQTKEEKLQEVIAKKKKNDSIQMSDRTVTIKNEGSNTTSEIQIKDGKKNDIARQYYSNGQVWKESPYKDGLLNGVARIYREDGKLKRTVGYTMGKKDGKYTKYFKSGKPKIEMTYKQDLVMPGTIERDFKNEVIPLPKIIQSNRDRLVTENTYEVILKLDKKAKDIRFYGFPEDGLWDPSTVLTQYQLPQYQDSRDQAYISFTIEPGYYMVHEIFVYASYITSSGNDAVSFKRVNIAIEN